MGTAWCLNQKASLSQWMTETVDSHGHIRCEDMWKMGSQPYTDIYTISPKAQGSLGKEWKECKSQKIELENVPAIRDSQELRLPALMVSGSQEIIASSYVPTSDSIGLWWRLPIQWLCRWACFNERDQKTKLKAMSLGKGSVGKGGRVGLIGMEGKKRSAGERRIKCMKLSNNRIVL